MYTVGQVAKFLGVSRDTLKFYEDKNLISPRQDEENGYRKYNLMDINDIVTVNFFRDIDLEIKKIQEIKNGNGLDTVDAILSEKQKKLEEEIEYKKLLLKRIADIKENCKDIKSSLNTFSIKEMKPIEVINEIIREDGVVETYSEILEKYDSSSRLKKAVNLSGVSRIVYFNSEAITDERYIFYEKLDESANKNSLCSDNTYNKDDYEEYISNDKVDKKKEIFYYPTCLYIVIAVSTDKEEEDIDENMANAILGKASELGYETMGLSFINILINTYEEGRNIRYLEIYTPVKSDTNN